MLAIVVFIVILVFLLGAMAIENIRWLKHLERTLDDED